MGTPEHQTSNDSGVALIRC